MKDQLRSDFRKARKTLGNARRAMEEELVNAAIVGDPVYRRAKTVALYKAVGGELSLTSVGNDAFRSGKRVLFPKVVGDSLEFVAVAGWGGLRPGAFGIPEPEGPPVPLQDIDLLLVPGVGFSPAGHRLGQGGGFYDKILGHGVSWGVAFECQLAHTLPVEPHDKMVDRIITVSTLGLDL